MLGTKKAAENETPLVVTPAEVARACNMSRRVAKTLLRAAGIAECGENGRWYVQAEQLRARLPDVYDRVLNYFSPAVKVPDAV